MSHIPQFEDATTSLAGDAATPAGDLDVSAGDAHLRISGYVTPLFMLVYLKRRKFRSSYI